MKVLLINSNQFKQPWPVIPLGLCCVAATLEEAGQRVRVLDLCFSRTPSKDIISCIGAFKPDVIGVNIRNIDNGAGYKTQFFLDKIKEKIISPLKANYSGPIVLGGPAVGINGAEMLHFFDLSFAIQGEGEQVMLDFVKRIEKKESLSGLGGLIIRQDNEILENNAPVPIHDFNALPPARPYRYIDVKRYNRYNSPIQIQTKRGCPLACVYCTYNHLEGSTYRLKDPKRVADEIEELVRETGQNHIEFTDSTFNIPLDHAKAVLRAVADKGLDLRLRTLGLNPAGVDEELLDLMVTCGFNEVDLGAESCCDATLKGLGKNFAKADVLRAGELLRRRNLPTSWILLVGAPGETRRTLNETFNAVAQAASKWDLVIISASIRAYKGAPLSTRMIEDDPACTKDNFLHPVPYAPNGLTPEDIWVAAREAYLENPNFIMYSDDLWMPGIVTRIITGVLERFSPKTPVWKAFILYRFLERKLRLTSLGRFYFHRKHRERLSRLDSST